MLRRLQDKGYITYRRGVPNVYDAAEPRGRVAAKAVVCTENLIRVDDAAESLKLAAENRCIQMPLYRILLATEFGRIGQIEKARSFAASAEALVKQTGERWAAPEIYRVHGSLLCREPLRDDRAAMRLFKRSLTSARKLGSVGWELRTAVSIARLVSAGESASRRAEARDPLISTRAKFASAEASRDLHEADELVRVLD